MRRPSEYFISFACYRNTMDAEQLRKLKERRDIDNARRAKRKRVYYCTFKDHTELLHAQRLANNIEAVSSSNRRESFINYPHHACLVFYFEEQNKASLNDLEGKVRETLVENGLKVVGETKYNGPNSLRRINQWVMSTREYSEIEGAH